MLTNHADVQGDNPLPVQQQGKQTHCQEHPFRKLKGCFSLLASLCDICTSLPSQPKKVQNAATLGVPSVRKRKISGRTPQAQKMKVHTETTESALTGSAVTQWPLAFHFTNHSMLYCVRSSKHKQCNRGWIRDSLHDILSWLVWVASESALCWLHCLRFPHSLHHRTMPSQLATHILNGRALLVLYLPARSRNFRFGPRTS